MKRVVCTFVGADAPALAMAEHAMRAAFPQVIVKTLSSIEDALRQEPTSAVELLVMRNCDTAEVLKATIALDCNGLKRWAVVVLGEFPNVEGAELVSLADWNERMLARVFGLLVSQHQLLRENARLRGDMRTISRRVMHDLRTPLGAILSGTEGLKELLNDNEPSSASLAESIFESVAEMQRLMERVSMLTRASADPPSKASVAMGEVVFRALQRLESRVLKKRAIVVQPPDWPEIRGVSDWLETIWLNLVAFILRSGKDDIRIELGWSETAGETRFFVRSSCGTFMSIKRELSFQPFHLLQKTDVHGALELSIVQRLVDLQGGRCGYEAPNEGGACFFTLPVD